MAAIDFATNVAETDCVATIFSAVSYLVQYLQQRKEASAATSKFALIVAFLVSFERQLPHPTLLFFTPLHQNRWHSYIADYQ